MPGPETRVFVLDQRTRRLPRSVALTALVGLLFFAGTSFAAPRATTLYGLMGDSSSNTYRFATVNTSNGLATTLFFTLSYPISALTYDPIIRKFVAVGQVGSIVPYVGMVVTIDAATQTVEEHSIGVLPVSPFTSFVGVVRQQVRLESDPTRPFLVVARDKSQLPEPHHRHQPFDWCGANIRRL
jgi:hypothetical protein